MADRLDILNCVRSGLTEWGTTDYRTMTGHEGFEYLTEALRRRLAAEAADNVARAKEAHSYSRTTVDSVDGFVYEVGAELAIVNTTVINRGEESGIPFSDQLSARVMVMRESDAWQIADVAFQPLAQPDGASARASAAQRETAAAACPLRMSRYPGTRARKCAQLSTHTISPERQQAID